MRIFITDDSAIVRERLVAMFTTLDEGIEIVGEAPDAPSAIESIRRLKPDVVVLDVQLQEGTGIDVLEQVKKDEPAPIVMILTNYPYPQYRRRCAVAGADFFFDKSTEFPKVPEAIRQLIRRAWEGRAP